MDKVAETRSALVQVLRECNYRCTHCSQAAPHSGELRPRPITHEEFGQRLEDLRKSGLRRVRLTGGEPLLHPGIDELVRLATQRGIDTSLITNGLLLEHYASRLADAGLTSAWISLYGASHELYASVAQRNPPVESLSRAIRTLTVSNVRIGVYCCLHPTDAQPDLSLLQLLSNAGIGHVKFLQLMEQGRALQMTAFETVSGQMLAAIKEFRACNPGVQIAVSMRSGQVAQFEAAGFSVPGYVGCMSGSPDSWGVDAAGLRHPCCLMLGSDAPASPSSNVAREGFSTCPALPFYPSVPSSDFVCPITYARLS